MTAAQPTPGLYFPSWKAETLLSAIELDVFIVLSAAGPLNQRRPLTVKRYRSLSATHQAKSGVTRKPS
jgi:hypothetical protein